MFLPLDREYTQPRLAEQMLGSKPSPRFIGQAIGIGQPRGLGSSASLSAIGEAL